MKNDKKIFREKSSHYQILNFFSLLLNNEFFTIRPVKKPQIFYAKIHVGIKNFVFWYTFEEHYILFN